MPPLCKKVSKSKSDAVISSFLDMDIYKPHNSHPLGWASSCPPSALLRRLTSCTSPPRSCSLPRTLSANIHTQSFTVNESVSSSIPCRSQRSITQLWRRTLYPPPAVSELLHIDQSTLCRHPGRCPRKLD